MYQRPFKIVSANGAGEEDEIRLLISLLVEIKCRIDASSQQAGYDQTFNNSRGDDCLSVQTTMLPLPQCLQQTRQVQLQQAVQWEARGGDYGEGEIRGRDKRKTENS